MKKVILLFLSVFLLTQTISAKEKRVRFNLKFGFIKGGEAEMVITDTLFNGRPAICYSFKGKTTGLANTLYGVNDAYETIVDAKTNLPLKAIRDIKENKYRWYNETYFYHDIDSLKSKRSGWRKMPENMVDIISSFFYFVREYNMEQMKVNEIKSLSSFHADKIDTISIKYLGTKRINTQLGRVNTYVLLPSVDKGKLLMSSDGLRFFISKELKIPVMLEFDMRVGALRAVLESYKIDGVEQVTD
ncbi:MAG: DUF3108 domain-containing protein [Prolixibacteraceae bacterium]|nr:DUF3108 domain-containing protein [Prolixibacteraceae bacterium]